MLPSAGYFKGFNCPFYDSGLCERPYCHFRHVKKDSSILQNDEINSGVILQKLVSAVVQKVLQQKEVSSVGVLSNQPLISECVNGASNAVTSVQSTSKVTYNPTPISELKKIINEADEQCRRQETAEQRRKHIPVPYTPRKPISLPIKRPADINKSSDSEALTYLPPPPKYSSQYGERSSPDLYMPTASVETYLEENKRDLKEYAPIQKKLKDKHNYVPTDKSARKKKRLEYNPVKVSHNHDDSVVKYQPTPKSLVPCFSSDEDEPEIKKMKHSDDLGSFDDLGPEFDMLDEILEEETCDEKTIPETDSDQAIQTKTELKILDKSKDSKTEEKFKHIETCKEPKKIDKNKDSKADKKSGSSHIETSDSNQADSNQVKGPKKEQRKLDKNKDSKTDEKSRSDYIEASVIKKDKKHRKDKSSSQSSKDKNCKQKSENMKPEEKPKDKCHKQKETSSHKNRSDKTKQIENNRKDKSHSSDRSAKNSRTDSKKHSVSSPNSKQSKTRISTESEHTSKHKTKHGEHKHKSKEKHKKDIESPIHDSTNIDNDDDREPSDEEVVISSESDEESRVLECKKIFEEYIPTAKQITVPEVDNIADDNDTAQYVPSKIRISRTSDKNIKVQERAPVKPDYKLNAVQAMNDRLEKVKEYHASRNHHTPSTDATIHTSKLEEIKTTASYPNNKISKVRIAHVPYASTLVNAKKSMTYTPETKVDLPSTSTTVIQTVKKGSQRTAHIPNEKFIDRPGVLEPLASKIPANIRSIYLNMMIDECLKIYTLPVDAYARAQHEELNTSKKCSKIQIYKNSVVLAVARLRKELQECKGIKKTGSGSVPQTESGQKNNAWSIECKNRGFKFSSKEFKGAQFYKNISKWILKEEQLLENGFPMAHPSMERGRAIIYGQNKKKPPKGNIRDCCRCKQDYTVDKRGFPAVKQDCIYHPNKKYSYRGETKYQCCGQDGMSDGCCAAPCHVWEYVDYGNLKGFVTTLPPAAEREDYGVYALDCEMCYTTHGLDLTRVTVIDSTCKIVYETLVKPLHPIIDYNTRYSGITEEQMDDVKTTLLEVQASLLTMFNSKTILIGHSLESDFKALKLIHGTVIDTSVLFPHKMGPPFKRALRNLSSEYLKKIIQNSVDGHDSAEDATVCMELVIYKLKEHLKTS